MKSLFDAEYKGNPYYPLVRAYYDQIMNEYQIVDYHDHPAVEIMYVSNGFCNMFFYDTTLTLHKNQFILIDTRVAHGIEINPDSNCAMLNIEFAYTKTPSLCPNTKCLYEEFENYRSFLDNGTPYSVFEDSCNAVFTLLKQAVYYSSTEDPEFIKLRSMIISQIMVTVADLNVDNRVDILDKKKVYVHEAMNFIRKNYTKPFHIDNIANHVHIHPAYLQRLFKTVMKMTITNYITNLRIKKAEYLLLHSNYSIMDISIIIGFNSQQYFVGQFKKFTGITPSRYKEQRSVNCKRITK